MSGDPAKRAAMPTLGPLAVSEDADACHVVDAADDEDWVVRFDKSEDFPAREWADNMVNVYNTRLEAPDRGTRAARGAGPP